MTAALSACAAPLAGIQAALETIAAQPDTPGGGTGGGSSADQSRRQLASRQLAILDQLLPQVHALVARSAAAGPTSPLCSGGPFTISAPGGGSGRAPSRRPPGVHLLPIPA